MMGILLLVWVREGLLPHVGPARVSAVGTGLLGLMGNKGAVACSLRIHSTSLCLVCAHLASGSSATDARNLEYHQLTQRIAFSAPGAAAGGGGSPSAASANAHGGKRPGEGGEGEGEGGGGDGAAAGGGPGDGEDGGASLSVLGHDAVLCLGTSTIVSRSTPSRRGRWPRVASGGRWWVTTS